MGVLPREEVVTSVVQLGPKVSAERPTPTGQLRGVSGGGDAFPEDVAVCKAGLHDDPRVESVDLTVGARWMLSRGWMNEVMPPQNLSGPDARRLFEVLARKREKLLRLARVREEHHLRQQEERAPQHLVFEVEALGEEHAPEPLFVEDLPADQALQVEATSCLSGFMPRRMALAVGRIGPGVDGRTFSDSVNVTPPPVLVTGSSRAGGTSRV
eukprot:CAMPEP_0180305422 /NCGR_PEP_ID=MMETSP0988-20121125/26377_1 /TAXON_ID=697907 /ORGANISM="non described non described, Strain CCMP2293" /LENGTH=211 /DNA_ID=CAMNT_0022287773 /DNA_START=1186 /DNA_END=1819 /DNA_ORIENTATION=-